MAIALPAPSIAHNKLFRFLQGVWIFVQTGGTKDTLVVKVPPMLPLPWLMSEKNVTI